MTKQTLVGAILGSLATVAICLAFDPRSGTRPSVWHDVADIPADPHEFDNWWRELGTAAWRQRIESPREELFFVGQIKRGSVRTSAAAEK